MRIIQIKVNPKVTNSVTSRWIFYTMWISIKPTQISAKQAASSFSRRFSCSFSASLCIYLATDSCRTGYILSLRYFDFKLEFALCNTFFNWNSIVLLYSVDLLYSIQLNWLFYAYSASIHFRLSSCLMKPMRIRGLVHKRPNSIVGRRRTRVFLRMMRHIYSVEQNGTAQKILRADYVTFGKHSRSFFVFVTNKLGERSDSRSARKQ